MGFLCGLLGERAERSRWTAKAVTFDPLSPFVRGIAGMSHYVTEDYDEAMRLYEEGLALDSNSVLCLWLSAIALERLGRFHEELERARRAVDLSRRSAMMVAIQSRALFRLGRVDEAHAILEPLLSRASQDYAGEALWLFPALLQGDDDAKASALQRNIDAGTGPATLAVALGVELRTLLTHPRLGPLVRQLSLFAERDV